MPNRKGKRKGRKNLNTKTSPEEDEKARENLAIDMKEVQLKYRLGLLNLSSEDDSPDKETIINVEEAITISSSSSGSDTESVVMMPLGRTRTKKKSIVDEDRSILIESEDDSTILIDVSRSSSRKRRSSIINLDDTESPPKKKRQRIAEDFIPLVDADTSNQIPSVSNPRKATRSSSKASKRKQQKARMVAEPVPEIESTHENVDFMVDRTPSPRLLHCMSTRGKIGKKQKKKSLSRNVIRQVLAPMTHEQSSSTNYNSATTSEQPYTMPNPKEKKSRVMTSSAKSKNQLKSDVDNQDQNSVQSKNQPGVETEDEASVELDDKQTVGAKVKPTEDLPSVNSPVQPSVNSEDQSSENSEENSNSQPLNEPEDNSLLNTEIPPCQNQSTMNSESGSSVESPGPSEAAPQSQSPVNCQINSSTMSQIPTLVNEQVEPATEFVGENVKRNQVQPIELQQVTQQVVQPVVESQRIVELLNPNVVVPKVSKRMAKKLKHKLAAPDISELEKPTLMDKKSLNERQTVSRLKAQISKEAWRENVIKDASAKILAAKQHSSSYVQIPQLPDQQEAQILPANNVLFANHEYAQKLPNQGYMQEVPVNNTSLPFPFPQYAPRNNMRCSLREVIIDGQNVGFGSQKTFSPHRILICVDHFKNLGHKVIVFLPNNRMGQDQNNILKKLHDEGILVYTPSRKVGGVPTSPQDQDTRVGNRIIQPYDDRYIIQYATDVQGVVVSRDQFRDLVNEDPNFRETINERLLEYTFVGDHLMFPKDPLGRTGPSLDEFLSFGPMNVQEEQIRFTGRTIKYYPPSATVTSNNTQPVIPGMEPLVITIHD